MSPPAFLIVTLQSRMSATPFCRSELVTDPRVHVLLHPTHATHVLFLIHTRGNYVPQRARTTDPGCHAQDIKRPCGAVSLTSPATGCLVRAGRHKQKVLLHLQWGGGNLRFRPQLVPASLQAKLSPGATWPDHSPVTFTDLSALTTKPMGDGHPVLQSDPEVTAVPTADP